MDTRVYLKVKIKSLAEEARIIRLEEEKTSSVVCPRCEGSGNDPNRYEAGVYAGPPSSARCPRCKNRSGMIARHRQSYQGLRRHRVEVVRPEARATQLAYGFLRGRTYLRMEGKCHRSPDWIKVRRMVQQYGDHTKEQPDRFDAWMKLDGFEKVPARGDGLTT